MGRALLISSFVADGYVGLSAMLPVLQHFGHEVIALPTLVLSSHRGHAGATGSQVSAASLDSMADALAGAGRLAEVDLIATGYLPSPDHVAFARRLVDRIRAERRDVPYLCDPVLGDDPRGLYVDAAVAEAVRDQLMARATFATPNRFELAWLAGVAVTDLPSAVAAAREMRPPAILATSVPEAGDRLATVLVDRNEVEEHATPRLDRVPHGTGDVLAALFAAGLLEGRSAADAFLSASRALDALVALSRGRRELALVPVSGWCDGSRQPRR